VINLPSYHPAVVAAETAQFDHMSRGRLIFGIGPGALATDFQLFQNEDGMARLRKTLESIDTIQKIWSQDPPYRVRGEFWSVQVDQNIRADLGTGYMLKPFQKPHPPIAASLMSPFSGMGKISGERGWIPISANFIPTYSVASHWKKYLEGCETANRRPDPSQWRVARNIVVARSDEEARAMVFDPNGSLHYYFDYLWKALSIANYTIVMKADPNMPDADVKLEALMEDMIIYGAPKTVAAKTLAFREKVGAFGKLVLAMSDWGYNRAGEEASMTLLATEVLPLLRKAIPTADRVA
jgi:alkanesulfonate monooxygenase SsuD/methylene tetrahydromethanopterin reductase-like flavin-dependent oxidoreductase (luciferase family)